MGETSAGREWLKCKSSPLYFVHNYCNIYDASLGTWIPFTLWPQQAQALATFSSQQLTIVLKARQLGLTWLVLAYALYVMLFRPAKTVLLFSRRDDEAMYLLDRLRGMYKRLPEWSKARAITKNSAHEWELSNGSIAYAFPTTAGDSYTASLAIVDEADLVPDLDKLMNAVKPTIDGGGQMILLSRADKTNPGSTFKRMYRAARQNESPWTPVFLPWYTRPERTQEWYEQQKRDILARTESLDDLYQQYPSTEAEALAARSLDKRLPTEWLEKCFQRVQPSSTGLTLPFLTTYLDPQPNLRYAIGVDPAEGNPTSDDSSLSLVNAVTLEECALLAGRIQPSIMGQYALQLSKSYNNAPILVERNNHGHAVINEILHLDADAKLKTGWDGRVGWMSSSRGKALMYNTGADALREGMVLIHSDSVRMQLESIEGSTLRAPEGLHDDRATSFMLAILAAQYVEERVVVYTYV